MADRALVSRRAFVMVVSSVLLFRVAGVAGSDDNERAAAIAVVQTVGNGKGHVNLGVIKPGQYDLGQVDVGMREVNVCFEWVNDTGLGVTIEEIIESCVCLEVNASKKRVPPGQSVRFIGTYSLDRAGNVGQGFIVQFAEKKAKSIEFSFDIYRPAFPAAQPSRLFFGTSAEAGTRRTFTVESTVDAGVKAFELTGVISSTDHRVSCRLISTKSTTLRQPDTFKESIRHRAEFEARIDDSGLRGAFAGEFVIPLLLGDKRTPVYVPFSGAVPTDFVIAPDRIVIVRAADKRDRGVESVTLSVASPRKPQMTRNATASTDSDRIVCKFEPVGEGAAESAARKLVISVDLSHEGSFDSVVHIKASDGVAEVPVRVRIVGER